jgi:2-amino-4-hydroxy-6-hydroxymethyldihydropteridine diphosphokinase
MILQKAERSVAGRTVQRAGIGLGANLGDRQQAMRQAVQALRMIADFSQPVLVSSLYETAPIGCAPGTPSFYNAVVEFGYFGDPLELLTRTQMIEQALGRAAEREKNAPRTLDVDILYMDQVVRMDPPLLLPHPQLWERRFVLEPLAEIRPSLLLPEQAKTVAERLHELVSGDGPPVTKIHGPDWAR